MIAYINQENDSDLWLGCKKIADRKSGATAHVTLAITFYLLAGNQKFAFCRNINHYLNQFHRNLQHDSPEIYVIVIKLSPVDQDYYIQLFLLLTIGKAP